MAYLPTPSAERGLAWGLKISSAPGAAVDGIARTASRLAALVFAHGARAGVAQVNEVVVRNVAVVPFDIHTGAGGQIHLHRLGIGGRSGGLERGLHGISIAQPPRPSINKRDQDRNPARGDQRTIRRARNYASTHSCVLRDWLEAMRRYSPGVVAGVGRYIPLAVFGSFNLLQPKLIHWALGCFGIGSFPLPRVLVAKPQGPSQNDAFPIVAGLRVKLSELSNCRCAIADPGKFL